MPADPLRQPHDWLDHDAGPVVRPYAMTQGRVAPSDGVFDLVAFVVATVPDPAVPVSSLPNSSLPVSSLPDSPVFDLPPVPDLPPAPHLSPEHHAIVGACWEPISVVELASKLDLSIGVVRVLLGDLRSAGLISLYEPPAASQPHDVDVLKAVVNGLRAL
jgi:hypothetical protein